MSRDELIINIRLKGELKRKFEEVKQATDLAKPNSKIVEFCISQAHERLSV